ncbi:hypothetical protein DEU56DRAFT_745168 [Suillus clintonianus]|uniref:uncharacterized protein n=1 Tax=Suillus clintonianus TaxID=1904413 RepID=UPI001B872673|nr:uncharacterized protein DEU56DRAFT_745168 [Suillus clintonianus]KAG2123739.1 hypothetical protein DEU56DRAFT_745168 [Suillus clintonianus]
MTKHPSMRAVSIQKLIEDYGATHFRDALAHYIAHHSQGNNPVPLRGQALENLAHNVHFPFSKLPVFHKIKWCSIDAHGHGEAHVTLDSVHSKPQQRLGSRLVAHRSDTALVSLGEDSYTNDLKGT